MGTKHRCNLCKAERHDAVLAATASALTTQARAEAIAAAKKQHPYHFRSYQPGVTRWYLVEYPWVAADMPVLVCSHNTAVTRDLYRLMETMCSTAGSCNPTAIADALAQLKALEFDRARVAYYGYQVCTVTRSPPFVVLPHKWMI